MFEPQVWRMRKIIPTLMRTGNVLREEGENALLTATTVMGKKVSDLKRDCPPICLLQNL